MRPLLLFLFLKISCPTLLDGQTVRLFFSPDSTFVEPKTEFWLDLRAENFDSIATFQFTLRWDTSRVRLLETATVAALPDLFLNPAADGKLSVAWIDPAAQATSLADSTPILKLKLQSRDPSPAVAEIGFATAPLSTDFYQFGGGVLSQILVETRPATLVVRRCQTKIELGEAKKLCLGDSLWLAAQCLACSQIFWENGQKLDSIRVGTGGWFHASASGDLQCFSSDSVFVRQVPLPAVELGADTSICPGEVLKIGIFQQPNFQYRWSGGQATAQISVAAAGQFWIEVADSLGCRAVDTIRVFVFEKMSFVGPPLEIRSGDTAQLSASGGIAFEWSGEGLVFGEKTAAPLAAPTQTTDFQVKITDEHGCSSTLFQTVEVLPQPPMVNCFTPNGDGVNDFLELAEAAQHPENRLTVWDKLGNVVFEKTNYLNDWDGRLFGFGQIVPPDNYFMVVAFRSGAAQRELRGILTILH